jgi:mono/diheme cytochrome c family protein
MNQPQDGKWIVGFRRTRTHERQERQRFAARSSHAVKGKAVYEQHCLACHGAKGKGNGYPFLKPPPADLSAFATRSRTDAELLVTIRHGPPGNAMGAWKVALTEEESRHVLAYVRTLQK